ncbi:50S ribosomal protein L18e [Candidatus Woesearchaeota archaeon]|nr:MAG: 50S ribosomal protein L18e [Candidatus Woesearchaeota archaeon]
MKRTGPTNPETKALIGALRKESASSALWKRIADDLEKPSRARRAVNISRIARNSKEKDTIIVPGKVLGSGAIKHSITVAALSFSAGAKERIEAAKGKALTISELLKQKPKPQNVRIIG